MKIIVLVYEYLNRNIKNRILTGFIFLGIFLSVFSGDNSLAATISFEDIQGHWAQTDIKKAVDTGYVKGYPDSTFRPDMTVTRAEFVTMLNAAFAVPLDGIGSSFEDVKSSDWFANDVWSAVNAGYLDVYTGDAFKPNQPLTRQETAALTANLTKIAPGGDKRIFKDGSQIAVWARQQVDIMVSVGVINGYPDGYFRPDGDITRAEAVAIINRARTYLDSTQMHASLTVTGSTVNIRSGPDTSYSVITKVNSGNILTTSLHSSNDWYKVTLGDLSGWIIGDYVTVSDITDSGVDADRGGDVDRGGSSGSSDGSDSETDPVGQTGSTGSDDSDTVSDPSEEVDQNSDGIKLIIIDAGHGGVDDGASGRNGTKEKDINLAIALKLSYCLKDAGYSILLTRPDDTFISLDDRSIFANSAKADIFISIHCNASRKHDAGGTEVYTEPVSLSPVYQQQEDSKRLAALVQDELVKTLGLEDRGIKEQDLSVCRETNAPAILIETAFIDNISEDRLLNDPVFQDKTAAAIKQGIDCYFLE